MLIRQIMNDLLGLQANLNHLHQVHMRAVCTPSTVREDVRQQVVPAIAQNKRAVAFLGQVLTQAFKPANEDTFRAA